MNTLADMRTAIEHLEAALRELQDRVSRQEITPEIAAELSERLQSASSKISELEKRFESRDDA